MSLLALVGRGRAVAPEPSGHPDPDTPRPGEYDPIVFRDFNSKAANDSDRGTGDFPSKTGGSEGWDGLEWDEDDFLIAAASALPWLSGPSPYDDGNGNVMRTRFPEGFPGDGSSPVTAQTQSLGGGDHLWMQSSIAFEDTFQEGPANLNKLWFVFPSGAIGGMFLGVRAGEFRFNLQGTPDNGRGDLANNVSSVNTEPVFDGRWYTVLLEFVATGSASTGEFRMWICDHGVETPAFVKVAEYTDVNFGAASFSRIVWSPVWGGQDAGMSVDPEMNYAVDTVKVWGY